MRSNEKFKGLRSLVFNLSLVTCHLLLVVGCGYSLHTKTSLPFDSIQIGKIENKTLEPKLQDRLHKALTEEFLRHGIQVGATGSGYRLECIINHFDLNTLSEKNDITVEYEVVIRGDFKLIDPSGNAKDFKDIGSPFIVSFPSSGRLGDVLADKELVSERAVRDMAMEIVAVLVYKGGMR
ncbi:MAG: LPS assembly lipoprotein LptE [Nitrospirota bacterium]